MLANLAASSLSASASSAVTAASSVTVASSASVFPSVVSAAASASSFPVSAVDIQQQLQSPHPLRCYDPTRCPYPQHQQHWEQSQQQQQQWEKPLQQQWEQQQQQQQQQGSIAAAAAAPLRKRPLSHPHPPSTPAPTFSVAGLRPSPAASPTLSLIICPAGAWHIPLPGKATLSSPSSERRGGTLRSPGEAPLSERQRHVLSSPSEHWGGPPPPCTPPHWRPALAAVWEASEVGGGISVRTYSDIITMDPSGFGDECALRGGA